MTRSKINWDEWRTPLGAPDEFGIVYESWSPFHAGGIAVFDSFESRDRAIVALKEAGAHYWTTFKDVNGPGLSWAMRTGPMCDSRSKNPRLASVRRAKANERARADFQRSLFRNPGYDLVNEPIIESRWA